MRIKTTLGLKASEIARQQLDRLELGRELARVPYGCVIYCLPPSAQVQLPDQPATSQA